VRTVGVELQAKTAGYVRDMKGAAKVTSDVKDEVDKAAKSAPALAAGLDSTGRAAKGAAGDVDNLGDELKSLDRQILKTEAELKLLGREFARTGDVDVMKSFRKSQGELRKLGSVRKVFADAGDDAGGFFAVRFLQRIGPAIAEGPGLAVAGTAIGVAFAPSIAAGLGAAISGGVGAAAIAGGIALVAKDPLVAAAGKDVGQRFAAGVTAEAQTFRQPVLNALNQIDEAAARTVPKIGQMFRNTAPSVDRLTGSLIRAGEAITDGLVAASSRSAGPLGAIGDLVESVGTEFGHSIDVLSQRSPEGVSAINDLSNAATNLVRTTTGIIDGVARVKGGLDSFDKGIDSARFSIEDFFTKMSGGRAAFDITADGYKKGSAAAELYRKGVIGINGSLNDYAHYQQQGATATHQFIQDTYKADPPMKALVITLNNAERAALGERNALVGLSNQLRAQTDPAFALIEAQKNLKTAQDNAAAAVKNHGRNSKEAKEATRNLALAAIDLQGKVGALGTSFSGKLSPAMIATLHAGGLTDQQIKDVAKQFRDAKRDGDKYAKRYSADARLTGGPGVSTKLKILGEMQAALAAGNKPASYYGNLNRALLQARMAEGGPIPGYSPSKRADNIPIAATAGEYMQPVDSVDYYGVPVMDAIRKRKIPRDEMAALASYAGGGLVWPYNVTASQTRVPSWKEASSVVVPAVPKGQTLDFMVRAVHAAFPGMRLISGYRPGAHTLSGALSYHALKRATDWPASMPLAEWINARYFRRTKELISPWNSLNIHNGTRHAYSGAVYRQHSGGNAHVHWAMAGGGVIREPVFGVGASGDTYSFAENGIPETVIPGAAGRSITYQITVNPTPLAHPRDIGREVVWAIQQYEGGSGSDWRR
jgi:hypothetical protein